VVVRYSRFEWRLERKSLGVAFGGLLHLVDMGGRYYRFGLFPGPWALHLSSLMPLVGSPRVGS